MCFLCKTVPLNALPRFSRSRPTPAAPSSLRQGSSFFTRCGRPRASAQLSPLIYRYQAKIPGPQPFPAGRTKSDAKRVVEAIQHEQVRVEEKTKRDQCSLLSLGITDDGVSRSCKVRVWRNLDHGPPSWTVRLYGPGWQASVLDFPDLSASPDEIGHTMASHGAEMLVQDICLVIHHIQFLEKRCSAGFFSSIFPKVKMIMKDHCLLIGIRMPPPCFAIGVFCLLAALAIPCLYRVSIPLQVPSLREEQVEGDHTGPRLPSWSCTSTAREARAGRIKCPLRQRPREKLSFCR